MAINTILLSLSLDPKKVVERNGLKSAILETLSKFIPELKLVYMSHFEDGSSLSTYIASRSSFITVRSFAQGHVSINIEYYLEDGEEPLLQFKTVKQLETTLTNQLGSLRSQAYPPFKRGIKAERYFLSSDDRILEYDIDGVIFQQESPYQKVEIFHSKSLGNVLVLDESINMSSRDLIYTETLMQRGKEDYAGKEIVILGGGDGATLYELLKEKPKFVTMLELDEVVIRACREHMRGNCGDCLDQLEGPNYKIVIGDCLKTLDKMIIEGKKVDYVFGCLTDIPLSINGQGEGWDLYQLIMSKVIQVLKPTGKFLNHCDAVGRTESMSMYEGILQNLKIPVEFTKDVAFIPSFMEEWVFYQVVFKQDKQ